MNLLKAQQFLSDAQYYYRWYLTLPNLEPDAAMELADEFLEAVEQTLLYLVENPLAGRPRCVRFSDLQGFRSWRVSRPFHQREGSQSLRRTLCRVEAEGRPQKDRSGVSYLQIDFGQRVKR